MQYIDQLLRIGAIQFGKYILKNGSTSPIYIDLRMCIAYPDFMLEIAKSIFEKTKDISFNLVCGVPYSGICFASAFSLHTKTPMVLTRKEQKKYGRKKVIEGVYYKNNTCLIIEDITTSGSSLVEVVRLLKQENLQVHNVISIIDRDQGAKNLLLNEGCQLISLFSLSKIIQYLFDMKKIRKDQFEMLQQI